MLKLILSIFFFFFGLAFFVWARMDAMHSANYTPWYGPTVAEISLGLVAWGVAIAELISGMKKAE